jgi:hypothetical protein
MMKTAKQQRRLDKRDQRQRNIDCKETITTNEDKYMISKDQRRQTHKGKGHRRSEERHTVEMRGPIE